MATVAPNIRYSKQRRIILEELRQRCDHPTADEVYAAVRRKVPRVSLGTVYRNLDFLARAGLVKRLELGAGQSRFDADQTPHYHVRCEKCGALDDVSCESVKCLALPQAGRNGFVVTGARLEFTGVCPRCQSMKHQPDVGHEKQTSEGSQHD